MTELEFDEAKSRFNLDKHGTDFCEAQVFRKDPNLLEVQANCQDEPRLFDQGVEDLDLSTVRRVNQTQKRINVDFPSWVVDSLDKEAARIGVTRQSIIKVWLVE